MALLTANDAAVLEAYVSLPITGRWVAEIAIDSMDAAAIDNNQAVEVKVVDGTFALTGTAVKERAGEFLSVVKYRIVGGANKLATPVTPRFYGNGVRASDVINNLIADVGERLSSTVDRSLLVTQLAAWTTAQTNFHSALVSLLEKLGDDINYRYLTDGTIWIGRETWAENTDDYSLMSYAPNTNIAVLGIDQPSYLPGQKITGLGRANYIQYAIEPSTVRATIWLDASYSITSQF